MLKNSGGKPHKNGAFLFCKIKFCKKDCKIAKYEFHEISGNISSKLNTSQRTYYDVLDNICGDCVAVDAICLILSPEKQIHVASN